MKFVEEAWNDLSVARNNTFIIKEKLKLLSNKLRIWNKEKFRWINFNIEEATKKLNTGGTISIGFDNDALVRKERELERRVTSDDLWKHMRLK